MESTVVDISIPLPSFKPVSLSLSRISSIVKHPKQVFFNPINIFDIFYHTLLYCLIIILFFVLTFKIIFLQEQNSKQNMLETLSTWQNVTHLLGKRMGAKTNFYCDKKGLITKTILNRLLSVANQAFLDQSSQRILIRK